SEDGVVQLPRRRRDVAVVQRRGTCGWASDDESRVDPGLLADEPDGRLGALDPSQRIRRLLLALRERETLSGCEVGEEPRAFECTARARVLHVDAAGEEVREPSVTRDHS